MKMRLKSKFIILNIFFLMSISLSNKFFLQKNNEDGDMDLSFEEIVIKKG
jgi:hypothetical protein